MRLVADDVDMYVVGECRLVLTDGLLHHRAELDDVLALRHL